MSGQQEIFFHEKNEAMLQRVLYSDICRRTGGDLSERQADRLIKTVKHYMSEVHRVKGETATVGAMNKEVLHVVLPDYLMYIERSARGSGRSVVSDIEIGPGPSGQAQGSMLPIENSSRDDIDTAFSRLQNSRQQGSTQRAAPTDFRISMTAEGPVPIDVFERIKQDRQDEAARATALVLAGSAGSGQGTLASGSGLHGGQMQFATAGGMQRAQAVGQGEFATASPGGQGEFAIATDNFARGKRRAQEESEAAFAEAERRQLEVRASASQASQAALPAPPDMRALFMGDKQNLERSRPQYEDTSLGATRQQMIITREPSTIEYKETELNLFAYSGDRNWASDVSSESRYNFSVAFNPNNMASGLRLSPASTVKFRNIVRIELVKAIMPGESLDNMVTRTYNSGSSTFSYANPYNMNILSFPYIQVRIPELDNNIFGTNLGLNSAFGVLQYDANWIYDTANTNPRGYFAMIPKFLKCQKVYSPTPLTTLQKLTFRFERPDGTPLSTVPDTLDIAQIHSSKEIAATNALPYGYDAAVENGTSASYYFLRTATYFNEQTVSEGDRILIQNTVWSSVPGDAPTQAQLTDFTGYITGSAGFLVVGTAYGSSFAGITMGANNQGYCNYILVRGKFSDPTTGSTITQTLGNTADPSTPGTLSVLTGFLSGNTLTSGRLLNQSHQVQVALRVITRDLDSTSVIRPDNL